jgi:hypothetical protein
MQWEKREQVGPAGRRGKRAIVCTDLEPHHSLSVFCRFFTRPVLLNILLANRNDVLLLVYL